MGWNILIEVTLEHEYYTPNMPPVTVRVSNPQAIAQAGLMMRQSGARIFILAEDGNYDLPTVVSLDLEPQNGDVIAVTEGGNWTHVPQIRLEAAMDAATLGDENPSDVSQVPGHRLLAQVVVAPIAGTKRDVVVKFAAVESHWAYHVIGPGSDDVVIEDAEGEVLFDPMGKVDLPDGTEARVIRSRDALPARARPGQRFTLSRPGPFGPRTLIPVLPAPQPLFARVPSPDGTGAIIQSDIYVSIF